jgi:hypothetical protein
MGLEALVMAVAETLAGIAALVAVAGDAGSPGA